VVRRPIRYDLPVETTFADEFINSIDQDGDVFKFHATTIILFEIINN